MKHMLLTATTPHSEFAFGEVCLKVWLQCTFWRSARKVNHFQKSMQRAKQARYLFHTLNEPAAYANFPLKVHSSVIKPVKMRIWPAQASYSSLWQFRLPIASCWSWWIKERRDIRWHARYVSEISWLLLRGFWSWSYQKGKQTDNTHACVPRDTMGPWCACLKSCSPKECSRVPSRFHIQLENWLQRFWYKAPCRRSFWWKKKINSAVFHS